MTLYEFISKFTDLKVKVIHQVPFKKAELCFEGDTSRFLAVFEPDSRLGHTRYYNAYIHDNMLVVIFQYNREVKE